MNGQVENKLNDKPKLHDSSADLNLNHIKIMNDFYTSKNSSKAILKLISSICISCDIDKLTVVVRNDKLDQYLMAYEFKKGEGFIDNFSSKNLYMGSFVNLLFSTKTDAMDNFSKLFQDSNNNRISNYYHTTNFQDIKNIMKDVGFVSENENKINDFYVSFADTQPDLFTYCAFERYNKKSLSQAELDFMNALCATVNDKVQSMTKSKKDENNLLLRNVVLDSENVPMAVIEKDTFKVVFHNELYFKVLSNIGIGSRCYELFGNTEKCAECCIDKNILVSSLDEDNKKQWIKKAIPFTLSNGKEVYMIYLKDITDYVDQLNELDSLTQSLLIGGFEEYYKSFVQRSKNNYALCSIDIDKFKYINNTFGYDFGDNVLKKIADVIRETIDSEENFCRVGEDKFSILVYYKDDVELHWKLRELTKSFENMKNTYFPDARITIIGGVTLVDKKLPLNILLDQATTARKTVKGSLKNIFSYYNVELDLNLKKEIHLEEQIPHAIANDEFKAFLQPKFDLKTKKICGAEALVRWITPKGMIFPDQFIPLFEKNGFILTLDFIIYDKVMKYIKKCLDDNLPVYPISVNVSRNHIKDLDFITKFMNLVKKYDIPHEYLELEVTESVFVEDKQKLKDFIDNIKQQNLKISIDDFGTAYSSLQTLTDIDVDILKIDKGFLDNVDCEEASSVISKDKILIKNIINLAKELDFKVICEGVETDNQIEFLKSIGCESGQGYVFAKPMSISDYDKQFIRL